MMALWALSAGAQEVPLEEPAVEQEHGGPESGQAFDAQRTIWGEFAIRQARAEIAREMEGLGWRKRERSDRVLVFRPPKSWMGRARLTPDGTFWFGRPIIGFRAVSVPDSPYSPTSVTGHAIPPGVQLENSLWILPSRTRLEPIHAGVRDAVSAELEQYREIVWRTAHRQALLDLQTRLDRLWELGEPLADGAALLDTPEARRRAALDFWSSRTATAEGVEVCEVVEGWLIEVVQNSGDPVTAAEVSRALQTRVHQRPLEL